MSNGRGAQMQLGWTVPSALSSRGTTAATRGSPERGEDIRIASRDRPHVGVEEQREIGAGGGERLVDGRGIAAVDRIRDQRRVRLGTADDVGCAVAR